MYLKSDISEANDPIIVSTADKQINATIDTAIAACLIALLLPVYFLNSALAVLTRKPVFKPVQTSDCFGRAIHFLIFNRGVCKRSAVLINIYRNDLVLFGLPLEGTQLPFEVNDDSPLYQRKAGLLTSSHLIESTGLVFTDIDAQVKKYFAATGIHYTGLILRACLALIIYSRRQQALNSPKYFSIFGLNINNVTMDDAIDLLLPKQKTGQPSDRCKTACFVNVNSVNQCASNPRLQASINASDYCFADGSGIRLAAKHLNINIADNINGTDMLPILCQRLQAEDKSLYLLGASPGIANKTAQRLQKNFPKLRIVGVRHGFFSQQQNQQEIDLINQANADLLLVALGSPHQEHWLQQNAPQLNCSTAIAVGGLFDFFAGKFSRAPLWMRELGLEWVWRLYQDPATKFNRYVIGNPIFLYRTYFTQKARRGF